LPLEPGWQQVAERARYFIEHEAPLHKLKTGTQLAPVFEPQTA
jgi:hypothetical protein